jgi:hypothetical protein
MHQHLTKPAEARRHDKAKGQTVSTALPGGNARWVGALGRLPLQAKLVVNEAGDAFEQEAESVAAQVMRMPDPAASGGRHCACGGTAGETGECPACRAQRLGLMRKGDTAGGQAAPPSVDETLRASGQPLDEDTRGFMEARFGQDFGGVRVHTGEQAAQSARDVRAHAYTVGQNVVFGAGQYAPGSEGGKQLLAHELAHVVQQTGAVQQAVQRDPTDPPGGGLRTSGLTASEWQLIAQARTYFNLPPQPTEANPTIVGVLRLPGAAGLIYVKSGEDGGPWGGTQRGGIPRGPGSGIDRYTMHHVEGHTAAIMYQRGAVEGELLLEKAFCSNCDRNIPQILPPGARLAVVQPDSTSTVRSSQLPSQHAFRPAPVLPPGGTSGGGSPAAPSKAPSTGPAAPAGPTVPAGSTPAAPAPAGTVPAGPGGSGAAPGSTGRTGGTTARVGTPDMNPVIVGGPSAAGQAKMQGALLGLQAIGALLNYFGEKVQRARVEEAVKQIEPQVGELLAKNPTLGVVVQVRYTKTTMPDSVVEGPTIFADLDFGAGATQHEAELAVRSKPTIRRTLGQFEQEFYRSTWLPPAQPLAVSQIRTPFPKVATGTFAAGQNAVQGVSFSSWGFDDTSAQRIPVPAGVQVKFFILRVPATIPVRFDTVKVPIAEVNAAAGGTVPAVDLDPILPFAATKAACVFPADEATDILFGATTITLDGNLLSRYPNIYRARWVRPENIQVLTRP